MPHPQPSIKRPNNTVKVNKATCQGPQPACCVHHPWVAIRLTVTRTKGRIVTPFRKVSSKGERDSIRYFRGLQKGIAKSAAETSGSRIVRNPSPREENSMPPPNRDIKTFVIHTGTTAKNGVMGNHGERNIARTAANPACHASQSNLRLLNSSLIL
jgi:hypothetical protein